MVVVAGEASGDLHGSNLVKAMKSRDPRMVFCGIGGANMERAGVEVFVHSSDMAVVGLTEVFHNLRTIVRAARKLKAILKTDRPDLLILIDYPDFNIHMARSAKRFHVPVLYYISPQVWAWRSGRVRKISRRIDRMAVILPFEKAFYEERGMEVDFVGHPLLDACPVGGKKEHNRQYFGVGQDDIAVGLLPGSRKEEVKNLLPAMVESVEILARRYDNIRCFLPLAPTIEPGFVLPFIQETSVGIELVQGDLYNVLSICDVALIASGTATLDAAMVGVPMVVLYKVSPFSYWFARMAIKTAFIGLVNLVAGEGVVRELIQGEVTGERIVQETTAILDDVDARARMIEKLKRVKECLGSVGASEKTAKIALEMMK